MLSKGACGKRGMRMGETTPIRVAQIMGKMLGGGVESVVMNYYRNIDRAKVQFDFIVDADSTRIPKAEIEALGGQVFTIPPYQQVIPYHRELVSLLRREQYPIVHSHINVLSVFPLFAAKRAGIPVRIAHSHSTAGKGEFLRNAMKYALRPFSKTFATHYCACAKHAGKWLFGSRAMKKGEVHIFHNAIDLDSFCFCKQTRAEVRQELGLPDGLVVGHVGRFMHQKNHKFLIEIFYELLKQRPDAVLLLIGEGPLRKEAEMLVSQLGIADHVRFLGQRADAGRLYQAMDLFLFPSFYEGLAVVCIEAQTANLPCLVSDQVAQETDILGSMDFFPLDSDAKNWADEGLQLLAKSGEREDCGERMRAAGYDIRRAAKELEEYYLMLSGHQQRPGS